MSVDGRKTQLENQEDVSEEDFDETAREDDSSVTVRRKPEVLEQQIIQNIPEVVEDFLRNFLRRAGLNQTLNSFETEWYNSAQKTLTETLMSETPVTGTVFIPDAFTHQQLLQTELLRVRREADLLRQEVLAAGESMARMQRERDFHRLRYRQVADDKNRLIRDFKGLKKHLQSYEPVLSQLDDKYRAALREKVLISTEKDRVQNAIMKERRNERNDSADKMSGKRPVARHPQDSEFPICSKRVGPQLDQETSGKWKNPSSFGLTCSIRAHKLPISCISLHPQKLMLASASDDRSWRLWALPASGEKVGEMMLTVEGHSDWLSGCSFHPDGSKLATTSGDMTVRLWDVSRGSCLLTFTGHRQPTWGCAFHSCGDFLASCSADRTVKLWDLNSQRCRITLRRHTSSVNSVSFLPSTNLLLTCSSDKTLALWDARQGVCTSTFHGHAYPCNHAAFSPAGDVVASCDSCGVINLWDVRKPVALMATVDAGPLGANQVAFNPSGKSLAVACSDRLVRLVDVGSCAVSSLSGHSDGVQTVAFGHTGETVISAGSDGLISLWSEHNGNVEMKN